VAGQRLGGGVGVGGLGVVDVGHAVDHRDDLLAVGEAREAAQAGADDGRIDAQRLAGGVGGGSVLAVVGAGQGRAVGEVDGGNVLTFGVVDQHAVLQVDAARHRVLAGDADDDLLVLRFHVVVDRAAG